MPKSDAGTDYDVQKRNKAAAQDRPSRVEASRAEPHRTNGWVGEHGGDARAHCVESKSAEPRAHW